LKLDENLEQLVIRLKTRRYRPIPARRVYIPKNETEKRPLGISALENKIVEKGITRILEAIYEQDFLDCSYGFRPKRNCHQALRKLGDLITFQPVNHIVEADIKGFFDNVSHGMLLDFLRNRVTDTRLLQLIEKFLKAGYVDDGLLVKPDAGTAQGSCLSPLLANIFLHYVLDVWFETVVKNHTRGFCELVRYADDFVCVVRYADDADKLLRGLRGRLNKYGLELHPDKTRKFGFGRFECENARREERRANTFDFLGFTHFCDKTRKGKFKVGRRTSRKKFVAKCKSMNNWLKSIRNHCKTKEWWKILAAKLRGHIQYYGVSENYRSVQRFCFVVLSMVHKWLNRRSQKCGMSWKNFYEYLQHYPLPKPRVVHNFYSSAVIGE
jgi:group II intron reverse transcriptase/maturase